MKHKKNTNPGQPFPVGQKWKISGKTQIPEFFLYKFGQKMENKR